MSRAFIPDDIVEFVLDKIDSIAQLEGLLLLAVVWKTDGASARLYINESETVSVLAHLQRHHYSIL